MGDKDPSKTTMLRFTLITLAALFALAFAAPAARSLLSDDIVCQATTSSSLKCHICIDKTWHSPACQGINQQKCVARQGQAACEADGLCSFYGQGNTCNDVNVAFC